MGNRAIYIIKEDGESTIFYAHYGANALSPLLRFLQAKEIQTQLPERQSISHIFEHLDYSGQYMNPWHDNIHDMFCERIEDYAVSNYIRDFANNSGLEMRITLDVDSNNCLLEYNRNCPWYTGMDNYSIPLDVGVQNVEKLLKLADKQKIEDFEQLLSIYHKGTGLDKVLENARGNERLDAYLKSGEGKADRERFIAMYGNTAEANEENEMEV